MPGKAGAAGGGSAGAVMAEPCKYYFPKVTPPSKDKKGTVDLWSGKKGEKDDNSET